MKEKKEKSGMNEKKKSGWNGRKSETKFWQDCEKKFLVWMKEKVNSFWQG